MIGHSSPNSLIADCQRAKDWRRGVRGKVKMAQNRLLNFQIIARNLSEAAKQLNELERMAASGELRVEQLQVGLLHAYHHINFSWNAKWASDDAYRHLTQANFKRWGRYPKRIENL